MEPEQPTQPPTYSSPPSMPVYPPPPVYAPPDDVPTYSPPPYATRPSMPMYPPPPVWAPPPPPVAPGPQGSAQQIWNSIPPVVRWLVPLLLILAVMGSLGGVVLYQHLVAKPDGYLGSTATEVDFIRLTEAQNGSLTGSLQTDSEQSDGTISTNDIGFTGTWNGSQVSFTVSVLGFYGIVTGTLIGNTLTLQVPDQNGYITTGVFQGASIQDFNTAVSQLRQHAAATQAAGATITTGQNNAQATVSTQSALDQAVTNANTQLSNDLSTLTGDVQNLAANSDFSNTLNSYANDWAQMQKDYQQEQSDYQQGCGQAGENAVTVNNDAISVNNDLISIQDDDISLSDDANSFNSDLQQVTTGIQSVQSDWQNLQAAVAADPGGGVSAQFSQNDINTALQKAQQQLNTSNSALQSAQTQAQQYDQEAAQTNTNAQNLVNSLHC
jgi:hypothetical protein